MALTDHQLKTIRSWIGTAGGETDATLEANYIRIGTFDGVIKEIIRSRIAELASQPQSLQVPGLSVANGTNLLAWQDALKRFNGQGGSGLDEGLTESPGTSTSRLVRTDVR